MNPYITEMEAIPVSEPHMVPVFNYTTLEEDEHYGYEAEIQYVTKDPQLKTILCSRLDTVEIGVPVMLVWHCGMKSYKHNRHVIVSNSNNCVGGFYPIMMKSYKLYCFTQPNCPPCERLKAHVSCLTEAQRASIQYVPLRAPNGNYTALAEELGVELTPTLVVTYEGVHCEVDADGDEDCDYTEEPVEIFVGANAIIEHLDSTIDAYTYANPE